MLSFSQFVEQSYEDLSEALITFAGKAYPKFGNVVILAGGAGSGKGFIRDKLLGIEGFKFDVDDLKTLAMKTPAINKKVRSELGDDLSSLDLKKPSDVARLHEIIGEYLKLDDKRLKALYTSILSAGNSGRLPNLIFDVTLKDLQKLEKITRQVKNLGYQADKIHVVWVINDIEVAKKQNVERPRQVPVEILVNTHRGASMTMNDIVNMGNDIKKYLNGDIVFAFNKVKVDSDVATSDRAGRKIGMAGKTSGGFYIKDANYFYVKRSGKPIDASKLTKDVRAKIASYVPPSVSWENG
jgi:predicted kinase